MPLTTLSQPVAQVVKDETAVSSCEAEAVLLPALQHIGSLQDYAAALKMFYGFFHPLQKRIHQFITPELLPDIDKRRATSFIEKDLAALSFMNDLSLCTALPLIESTAQAFGVSYVEKRSVATAAQARQFFNNLPAAKR